LNLGIILPFWMHVLITVGYTFYILNLIFVLFLFSLKI